MPIAGQQANLSKQGRREPTSPAASHSDVSTRSTSARWASWTNHRLPISMASGILNLPVSEDESSTRLATPTRRMQGESPKTWCARSGKSSDKLHRSSTPGIRTRGRNRRRFLLSQVVRAEPLGHCGPPFCHLLFSALYSVWQDELMMMMIGYV